MNVISQNYDVLVLEEITRLEKMGGDYNPEMEIIAKYIRNGLWKMNRYSSGQGNSQTLYLLLKGINYLYDILTPVLDANGYWNLKCVMEYVYLLEKYRGMYAPEKNSMFFEKLADKLQQSSASRIISKQWEDIHASEDGIKSFIEIFDDVFENAITKYKEEFIKSVDDKNILTRLVLLSDCDENRFIPLPDCSRQNRWNPPGRSFLYMSYMEKMEKYNDELSLGEYVCLLEMRTPEKTECSFCRFKIKKPGSIIDLSYNDVSLYELRKQLKDYGDKVAYSEAQKILSDIDIMSHINDEKYIQNKIDENLKSNLEINDQINILTAKQYLKMICDYIYQKVDGSEKDKEDAYKSFHILAQYLESKGISGIIYPCTRSKDIVGKNIVLFDRLAAKPIPESIRRYTYMGKSLL